MFKNKLTYLAMFVFIIGLSATQGFAQQESRTVRVKFKQGTYSRTYKGSISHSTNTYILGAKKGQTLTVTIRSSDGAVFDLSYGSWEDGDGVALTRDNKRRWSGRLPQTTDYGIGVYGGVGSSGSYSITFTIK